MAGKDSIQRIAAACESVVRRSDELVCRAGSAGGALAKFFTMREIRITNEICCEFLLSIAESASVVDLAANRANFERMRAHVMDANDVLVALTQMNPQTMSSVMNAEDTLIDMLVTADPTARLVAGFAKRYLSVVKSVLTSFFTDIGFQLEVEARGKATWGGRLRGALAAPVGSVVRKKSQSLFERYGDGRCERIAALAFMRSLYDRGNPRLRSWPKVVGYVRGCCDETDRNFARCAEIRAQVQSWARHEKDGVERVWRSLTQQLKLSHGRKPDHGFGPVAIPDACWA